MKPIWNIMKHYETSILVSPLAAATRFGCGDCIEFGDHWSGNRLCGPCCSDPRGTRWSPVVHRGAGFLPLGFVGLVGAKGAKPSKTKRQAVPVDVEAFGKLLHLLYVVVWCWSSVMMGWWFHPVLDLVTCGHMLQCAFTSLQFAHVKFTFRWRASWGCEFV